MLLKFLAFGRKQTLHLFRSKFKVKKERKKERKKFLFIYTRIWAYFGLDVEVGYRLERRVKNTFVGVFTSDNHICPIYKREFYIHGSVHRDSTLIRPNKMQEYAGIYLLQNHSTCFGCPSHPSSGVHKTVTAASGTGHSI